MDQSNGQKDETANLFAAWRSVFFGASASAKKASSSSSSSSSSSPFATAKLSAWNRPSDVNLGDLDIFADGLFENFFEVPLPDATLSKSVRVLDEFSACANIQYAAIMKSQYQLVRYARALPIVLASAYANVVHHGRKSVRFPYSAIEANQNRKKNAVLLQALWAGMGPAQGGGRPPSLDALVVDCLSYLVRIASPKFTVVSGQSQHVSPQERKTLDRLTDLWEKLGVALVWQRGDRSGAATTGGFVLDPPIDNLLYFSEEDRTDEAVNPTMRLGTAAKAVLARQLAVRREQNLGSSGEGFTRTTRTKTAEERGGGGGGAKGYVPSDRWKVCLEDQSQTATLTEEEKRKLDLRASKRGGGGGGAFLRIAGAANSKRRRRSRGVNKSAVVFKFKAGFTNAVRRDVLLADLLQ